MRDVYVSDAMAAFFRIVKNRRAQESAESELQFYLFALEEALRYIAWLQRTNERLVEQHSTDTRMALERQAEMKKLRPELPRWIPVEERLPDVREYVAIIIVDEGDEYYRIGRIRDTGEWWQAGIGLVHGKVTHWMPLPERTEEG